MRESRPSDIELLNSEVKRLNEEISTLHVRNVIYERALNASADGFLIVGRDGCVMEINKAYCDYFGINRDTTLGKHIYSIISNSKMIQVMDKNLTEVDAMHTFPDGLTASGEKTVAVTRMPVIENGETIASVAYIKFSHYTISLAKTLQKLEDEVAYYRKRLSRYSISSFEDLPSYSPRFAEVKRMAERFANSDLPILLLGETGVGKEVFANAIHQASSRSNQPLVCVNCASIPEELLESELFGYVDGAFTGSRRTGKKGKFEVADGGTLILDEIGEMPLKMQSKLLRVLQSQEVEKLGAEKPVQVNVRIIAATNQDLSLCVKAKTFRPDLFYRLNVLPITIPPLRERQEDIPSLADAVLAELVDKYSRKVSISKEAMATILTHSWPGNVRELRNAIGRGFMMTEGSEILPEHLPATFHEPVGFHGKREHPLEPNEAQSMHAAKSERERELILDSINRYHGNFSQAAKALGVHRATLYSKMHAMGIPIEQFRPDQKHL